MSGSKKLVRFEGWRERRVMYAFYRLLGLSRADAAKAVGAGRHFPKVVESSEDWRVYLDEARARFLEGLDAKIRSVLKRKVERMLEVLEADPDAPVDMELLKWWLERRDPEFAPPVRRVEQKIEARAQFFVGAAPAGFLRDSDVEVMDVEVEGSGSGD